MFDRDQVRARLQELAGRNIFVGTSSWKYEGWLGQLYEPDRYWFRGKVARNRFEKGCLKEYAETFKTVCVDAGFYRFPKREWIQQLCESVPEDFRFGFKVTDEITVKHFPNLDRHGPRAGAINPNFLNADLFERAFLEPCSVCPSKIGLLIFEFSRFRRRDFEQGRQFVAELDRFFTALPKGWQYGVELRNANLLQPEYFQVLRRHGVAHVFNAWTEMPEVADQMAMEGAFSTDYFGARFLLKRKRGYKQAVERFSPYQEVGEQRPEARAALRELAKRRVGRPSFVFVNNRLEGNALGTIQGALVAEK